ncbi:hypothetical protein BDV93DRAFT_557524 [Ceratobasidium sp. AG-I]|nr:hypothetical protein BDV93DRAFT_557524 [Ceratobasidium sp. AG-I]
MSETESEPTLKPKPNCKRRRHSKRCAQTDMHGHTPSGNVDNCLPQPQETLPSNASHTSCPTCPDVHSLFQRLNESLDNNRNNMDIEMDTLLELVNDVSFVALHGQPSSFVSQNQHTASASHGQAGLPSQRDNHRQPEPRNNLNKELDSGDESSDDGEYDPIIPDKSGHGQYPGLHGKVASHTIPKMMSMALRKGVYQDHNTALRWACNAYRRAWKEYCPHVSYCKCPKDLLQTSLTLVSNLCTLIKDQIRKIIRFIYSFKHSSSDEVTMSANRLLAARLGHNTFHCRDTVPKKDQYKHCALTMAIYEVFFWSPDSFLIPDCAPLKEKDKGLPLVVIAFVLTMMQECIEEWATGRYLTQGLNLTT